MFRSLCNVVSHIPKHISIFSPSYNIGCSSGTNLHCTCNFHTSHALTVSSSSKQRKKELQKELDSKQSSDKRKQVTQSPEITLVGSDGVTSTVTLAEASRLATRRNMKLIPHDDEQLASKRGKPVYKLISSKEFFQEHLGSKTPIKSSYIKGEMQMEVGHRISSEHLMVKVRTMLRGLAKMKQIKLQITGNATSGAMAESVLESIKTEVSKEGAKVANVQKKGFDVKCDINPPRPEKTSKPTASDS